MTTSPHRRADLDRYARSNLGRSFLGLATSVVPFIGLWVLMYLALPISYWLVLALAIPASGFLLRTYILFHDCVHGSFLSGRRANAWVGTVLALIVLTPFARWRHEHTIHHATAGDLDRRGIGDVPVLTVAEYNARSRRARLAYRLYRSPLVMFGLGPAYSTLVMQRVVQRSARSRLQRSVWGTNLVIALAFAALGWTLGWSQVLLVEAPVVAVTGGIGIWLFYVQHQYPTSYWGRSEQWSFSDAALRGSSYLRLPKLLQFFTGSIGLHHVHHLNPKIPNYNLQRAHDEQPVFHSVPSLSLWDGLRAVRLKLWDEETARLVTWRQSRARKPAPAT